MRAIVRPLVRDAILAELAKGETELLDFILENNCLQDFQLEPYGVQIPRTETDSMSDEFKEELAQLGPIESGNRIKAFNAKYGSIK
jgi:hypothetical protein